MTVLTPVKTKKYLLNYEFPFKTIKSKIFAHLSLLL